MGHPQDALMFNWTNLILSSQLSAKEADGESRKRRQLNCAAL